MKLFLIFVFLLSACSSNKTPSGIGISPVEIGPDMRYTHPSNEFSIARPKGFISPVCYESENEVSKALVLQDDFGHLLRVESLNVSDELALTLSLQCDKAKRAELLENIFSYSILPIWQKVCPLSAIKVERVVSIGDDQGYFAILYAPEGSTLIDTMGRKRADAWRAYLIAFHRDHLVVISTQESFYQLLPTPLEDMNPNEEKLFNDLKAAFDGYRGRN